MRTRLMTGLVAGLVLAGCARQTRIESTGDVALNTTPANSSVLPSGTSLEVRLDQEIGTKSSKVGDTFTATVDKPIVASNGQTVVPAGSKIYGKVTGLDNSDHVGEPAAIKVDFERIVINGQSHDLSAKVTATNLQTRGGDTRDETLKRPALVQPPVPCLAPC